MKMGKTGLLDILFLCLLVHTTALSLYDSQAHRELARYHEEVKILHDKLISEGCENPEVAKTRRSLLVPTADNLKLEVKKELYENLINMLVECRQYKLKTSAISSTQNPSTTPSLPPPTSSVTTSTHKTSTTPSSTPGSTSPSTPLPSECLNAMNLTESWRREHKGADVKPIGGAYNCDTRAMIDAKRPWFRFVGAAGSHLSTVCVPHHNSCGTVAPMWSDDPMPSDVGLAVSFNMYVFWSKNCKLEIKKYSVIRCSSARSDFVYRYDDNDGHCDLGFCGA